MSLIADNVYDVLKQLFPHSIIVREHYIYYKGTRLFFDFYMKGLSVYIECQGEQHYKYIKHFHGAVENFRAQKHRDNLKKEYIEEDRGRTLVFFYDKIDKITEELVINRIYTAQCGDNDE